MQVEWWRAAESDQYSLKDKLLRVGCRPLKRKYLACKVIQKSKSGGYTEESYGECKVRNELLF